MTSSPFSVLSFIATRSATHLIAHTSYYLIQGSPVERIFWQNTVMRQVAGSKGNIPTNKDALWQAVAPYAISLKAQYAFEELWERIYG